MATVQDLRQKVQVLEKELSEAQSKALEVAQMSASCDDAKADPAAAAEIEATVSSMRRCEASHRLAVVELESRLRAEEVNLEQPAKKRARAIAPDDNENESSGNGAEEDCEDDGHGECGSCGEPYDECGCQCGDCGYSYAECECQDDESDEEWFRCEFCCGEDYYYGQDCYCPY